MNDEQIKNYAKIGVIIIALIFVAILAKYGAKAVKNLLGLTAEEDRKNEAENAIKQIDLELTKSVKTKRPTKSSSQFKSYADKIENALNKSFMPDDQKTAAGVFMLMQNDSDFLMLKRAFGTRQDHVFGFKAGTYHDLNNFAQNNFNQGWIDLINRVYSKSKMLNRL